MLRGVRLLLILSLVAVPAGIYFFGQWIEDRLESAFFNHYYQSEITTAADRTRLDPVFLTAMVYVESKFRPRAVSSQGALGLMQLLPSTAMQVARTHRITVSDTEQLFAPDMNILIGALYIRKLLDDFRDTNLAIAAYNGGPGAVREWLKTPAARDSDVSGFDKGETKRYVTEVDRTYARLSRARRVWRWVCENIL